MTFSQKLDQIITTNNSLVCVGLDADLAKIPKHLRELEYPVFEFNKAIIDATYDLVCAYKPNTAFYEALGVEGLAQLKMTMDYLSTSYPQVVTILDAKRADIGNTNDGYVKFAFEYLKVDGITLHPYLGKEALQPFLDQKEKGVIVLCRTSNPGSGEFQDLELAGDKLYRLVARQVSQNWNQNKNCLLVVGATYPEEMAEIRKIAPELTFLVPGVGAQGGNVEATIRAGQNSEGRGVIISSSRDIIFASSGENFATSARQKTLDLRDSINLYRDKI